MFALLGMCYILMLLYHIRKILWDSYPALPMRHLASDAELRPVANLIRQRKAHLSLHAGVSPMSDCIKTIKVKCGAFRGSAKERNLLCGTDVILA